MAIVFVDMFFIYNFIINFILLTSTKLICYAKVKVINLITGAFLGAFYSVCRMIFETGDILALILDIIGFTCIVVISFLPKTPKLLLKNILVFFCVNFIYGGAMFFLIYFLKIGIHFGGGIFYLDIPVAPMVFATAAMYVFLYFIKRILERKMLFVKRIFKLEILIGNKDIVIDALYDTGNGLFEPISGAPVILIGENVIKEVNVSINTYRFVPYKSAGGCGYLSAFLPDGIKIDNKKIDKSVYVAIFSGILSKDGEYNAILHPLLMPQGPKVKEMCSVDI